MRLAKYKGENTKIGHGSAQVTEPEAPSLAWLNGVGLADFPINFKNKPKLEPVSDPNHQFVSRLAQPRRFDQKNEQKLEQAARNLDALGLEVSQ
jgi:hypothetical protein